MPSGTGRETDPATDRPATVAELFSNDQEMRFYRLLTMGMLVRDAGGRSGDWKWNAYNPLTPEGGA